MVLISNTLKKESARTITSYWTIFRFVNIPTRVQREGQIHSNYRSLQFFWVMHKEVHLRKERKKKKVWSWAGNICFCPRGIFEILNVISCHGLEQKVNSSIFFFLNPRIRKLMRVKHSLHIICIFVCVCAHAYIRTT